MNINDWNIVPGDKALKSALGKEKKRRQDDNITILDYQKNNLNDALKYVENFNIAIDAGASYGLMSYSLNEKFNQVHAFEVDPRVRDCLKQNIDKFNLDRVKVYECGLSDKEETVSLTYRKNTFSTSINKNQAGEFLCKTIDSFNFQNMDFIKIDCEGYEPYILRGAEETIKKHKPVILMEDKNYSGKYYGEKGNLAVDLLLSWGYTMEIKWSKDCVMIYKG
jgi:FkbM family methyltransferase